MKVILNIFFSLLVFLIALAVFLPAQGGAVAAPFPQVSLPSQGWQVCADLGIGDIPGGGGQTQHFEVCQGGGWMVQAYCLDPGMPVPPVGASCSLMNGDTFWCGDGTQELRLYQIIATPVPTPVFTLTSTPTATLPAPTLIAVEDTPTLTPTITYRPVAGGPGNLPAVAAVGGLAAIFIGIGTSGMVRWYRKSQRDR